MQFARQVESCLTGGGFVGQAGELGAVGDEAVEGEGAGGSILALAGVVAPVGELPGGFGRSSDLAQEVGGRLGAALRSASWVVRLRTSPNL